MPEREGNLRIAILWHTIAETAITLILFAIAQFSVAAQKDHAFQASSPI
jgi:hypothetical protein